MLRVRALASSSALLTGEYRVVRTFISVKPEVALFNGNGHTKRWNAGTTDFINSFSTKTIVTKLLTQKQDPLMKKDLARMPSSDISCLAKSSTYLKSNPLKQEAASTSRKISNASVRNVPNQFESADDEFEKITESSRRATSVGGTAVTGIRRTICPTHHSSETITIRISNISRKTAYGMIHSICKSVGPLEGLMRKNANEVEALFILKNNLDSQSILEQLNCKIVEKCRWSACISTEDSKDNDQLKQGDQIGSSIVDLMWQILKEFHTKRLLLEDLKNLHASLVHLENHPNKIDGQPKID